MEIGPVEYLILGFPGTQIHDEFAPGAFCGAVFERILGCPLTVEGHPRTLSGPSPDLSPARDRCTFRPQEKAVTVLPEVPGTSSRDGGSLQ